MNTVAREEHEWQTVAEAAGLHGRYWALVKLLLKKEIITLEELREALATEAANNVFTRGV